ncbi:MAG: lipocalin family protein [Trueperaceae bacterium]
MERFYFFAVLLLLTSCVPRPFQAPYPVEAVVLPKDDGAHPAPIEWWYYTGHFSDETGNEYGFELSFFKAYAPPSIKLFGFLPAYVLAEKGHVAHFAITDKSANSFEKAEKADFWGYEGRASSDDLDVEVANWYARRSADGVSHDIYAMLGSRQLKLTLTPEKPAALHGNPPGIQSMGPGGVSYYVSYTRMKATGTLSTDCTLLVCKEITVTGQAWHDHQWGDFDLSSYAGWDWFSVQFDNNTELMLYLIRQPNGTYSAEAGSFVTAEGKTIELANEDFDVTETGEIWTSEATGAIYPIQWQVTVPRYGIDVLVNPFMPNQEMDTRASTGIVYWEGAVDVLGSHEGVGYVELTNYDLYPYGETNTNTPLQQLRGPLGF